MNPRICFVVAMLLLMAPGAQSDSPSARPSQEPEQSIYGDPDSRFIRGWNGKHTFSIRLARRSFRRHEHKITGSEYNYLVDGKMAIGTDGGLPREELYRFEVQVNGRKWVIPPRLWRDCYDPNLGKHPGNQYNPDTSYVQAWLSKDGKRLTVKMLGSDGAGGYRVIWYLRRDGRHHRKISFDC